ncbi:SIMPL domain-containing protein [Altererythrobacter sp. CAU 1778]
MIRPISAFAVLAAVASPAIASEVQVQSQGPVVALTVTESVEAAPDIVEIGAGVSTTEATAVEAMRANSQKMAAVVARIKSLGIAARDIQTTGINLSPRYDYDQRTQDQVFRGYVASNRVSVTLRDVAETGEVLDALVEAGANDISGPSFSIDDDTAARSQARQAALKTAQAQASDYARWAGYSGVRLLEISETSYPGRPMPMAARMVADSAAPPPAPPPVEPGLVGTSVTVSVTYEMTR